MPTTHDRKQGKTGKPMRLQLTSDSVPQSVVGASSLKIFLSSGLELGVTVIDGANGIVEEVVDSLNPVEHGEWGVEVHATLADGKTYVFPETEDTPQLRVHRHYDQ